MAYKELDALLAQAQSALGTKQSSLTNSNFVCVGDGFSLDFNQEFAPVKTTRAIFGQAAQVKGAASVDVKIDMPVVPTGAVTAPSIHDFLTCSGMVCTTSTNKRTYAPSSVYATDWKDLTLWSYTGDKATGDCLLTKAHSVMLDWKLSGEVGKPLMINFTGKGVPDGAPAAASYVSGTLTPQTATIPAVLKGTVQTIGGLTGLKILKFDWSIGNKIELLRDITNDHGYYRADIVGRESKFNITCMQENIAPNDPHIQMVAPSLTTTTITFGTAGSRITIGSGASKTQITAVKNADDNGVKVFEISGILVDNDFTFIINDD